MANTSIQITDLDFQEIKASLKSFLESQSEFTDYDFTGSAMDVLLDTLAYNTHYNAYYLNMIANESFLDSAIMRDSVVSHAKKYGYVPRSARSSVAYVNITVTPNGEYTSETYTIPKYTSFVSKINGKVYNFVNLDEYTATLSGGTFLFTEVALYEGNYNSFAQTVNLTSNPNLVFTVPDINVDTSHLSVTVLESSISSNSAVYTLAADSVTDVKSDSKVYYLQESSGGYYQIYFGDDVLSKKLVNGNIVVLSYLKTTGTEANKANTFSVSSAMTGVSNFVIDGYIPAAGGSVRETVDQIKFSAPLNLLSQNRAVTKNDYVRLIKQKYPAFEAVNVWGGEEQEPPVYGKVFISAKPRLGFQVSLREKEYVKNNILKPISVLTVTPEIIDVDYNYLKVESHVVYDKSKTSKTEQELKNQIKTTISNYTVLNTNKFSNYFKYSGLEALIDDSYQEIIANEIDFFVAKKFRPRLNVKDSYILDFGFELNRGANFQNFYSSPNFTVYDENGVLRDCFFEEIPSSYTGVESITITNPGYDYTSTPTVTIIGDGSGATAVANIVNGKLQSVTITNSGIGYSTAAVQITGGGGQLASGSAVLQGRYGKIRISYYRTDPISGQSTKSVINSSLNSGITGTIDYLLGKIYINDFQPVTVDNAFGDIMVHMKPGTNIIQSKFNKMLVIDLDDPTSISIDLEKAE